MATDQKVVGSNPVTHIDSKIAEVLINKAFPLFFIVFQSVKKYNQVDVTLL